MDKSYDDVINIQSKKYSKAVLDRFYSKKNMGKFEDTSKKNIGVGLVGSPACGDLINTQIKVQNNIIVDAKTQVFGCKSAIASASLAIDKIIGANLEEAAKLKNIDLSKELSLLPIKLHCSMLAEESVKDAIKNYKEKNAELNHIKMV
ncbi:MAG: iron-sulfur cluster assembly scaffold protein [Pseudomonadota bacterium]